MSTQANLLVAGALSAIVLTASVSSAQVPLKINQMGGTVQIHQTVPAACGDPVDVTASIAQGQMDISVIPRLTAPPVFELLRLNVSLTPFSVRRNCGGTSTAADFRAVSLRLFDTVRVEGEATGPSGSGQFVIRIPPERFAIYQTVFDNLPVPQPETMFQRPSELVTGVIDVNQRTVTLHVVLSNFLVSSSGVQFPGTQTADIRGEAATTCPVSVSSPSVSTAPLADTTPPDLICMPVDGVANTFRAIAADECGPATIHLGQFELLDGETFQLQKNGQPGVRQVKVRTNDGIRHFQVGKSDALITATDPAGNLATASCR